MGSNEIDDSACDRKLKDDREAGLDELGQIMQNLNRYQLEQRLGLEPRLSLADGPDDLAFCQQVLDDARALSAAAQRLEIQIAAMRAKIDELHHRIGLLQQGRAP